MGTGALRIFWKQSHSLPEDFWSRVSEPTFLEADALPLPAQEATGSCAILGVRLAWSVPWATGHSPSASVILETSRTVEQSLRLRAQESARRRLFGFAE